MPRRGALCLAVLAVIFVMALGCMEYATSPIMYSPGGRVLQVEFARETVKRGTPVVGIRGRNGLILITQMESTTEGTVQGRRKWEMVEEGKICLAWAGLAGDAVLLAKLAKLLCSRHREVYGAAVPVENLSDELATALHQQTRTAGRRPLGIGALVCGVDDVLGAQLYTVDTQGRFEGWRAIAMGGPNQDKSNELLAELVRADLCDKSVGEIVAELRKDSCRLLVSLFASGREKTDVPETMRAVQLCTCVLAADGQESHEWSIEDLSFSAHSVLK